MFLIGASLAENDMRKCATGETRAVSKPAKVNRSRIIHYRVERDFGYAARNDLTCRKAVSLLNLGLQKKKRQPIFVQKIHYTCSHFKE